jgi:hypothetical protein
VSVYRATSIHPGVTATQDAHRPARSDDGGTADQGGIEDGGVQRSDHLVVEGGT